MSPIHAADPVAIREAIEHRALVTRRDPVLLELYCVFDAMKTLRQLGWKSPPPSLFGPAVRPPVIFRGVRDGATNVNASSNVPAVPARTMPGSASTAAAMDAMVTG